MKTKKQIKILSLATDIDRRLKISSLLNRNNLSHEFIDAPDGRQYTINRSSLSKLTNTEAACALGHISIYKEIIESNEDYAIILEDDVTINDNEAENLRQLIDIIDFKKKSIYILGGQDGLNAAKYFVGKLKVQHNKIKIFQSYRSSKYIFRTCCYIITKPAAYEILRINSDLLYAADNWSAFVQKKIIEEPYIVYPPIFSHPIDLKQSHIQQSRTKEKNITYIITRPIKIMTRIAVYALKSIASKIT